jgi:small nuclear ribonucleoprotein (snRNP)-like protein
MRKLTATLLACALLTQIGPAVSAKQKGDWNAVKALANRSVAVKTKNGKTHYGFLQAVDETDIQLQIAGEDDFTAQEISFQRDEVQKVWRAKLRFGETNIAKGAWIGAGVGFVATVATLSAVAGKENADRALFAVWFPALGAGIGAVTGALRKTKHKKQELIYSI